MSRIRQLSAQVINKIAAGEVIERPASVVKELLENSVDACAQRIEVDVADGGAALIRIVDDGHGIHPDDMLLAVTCHATSKLESADDLFRVQTLGFRGEALASIASVSQFRIRSRPPECPEGTELVVDGGTLNPPQPCGCAVGTSIEVRDLFGTVPVRRKFLKTAATELGHITEQFLRIALANPRLHLVLRHNDKVVYELPATDRLADRLRLFYGAPFAERLISVSAEANGVRLWGYVGHPSESKSTRKSQYLFLNGRWIQDRSLQHALGEAYRGLLMVGRYPVCFLFLEMPADQVDVNVHPTKAEVRFRDGQQLYRLLLSTLRTQFLGMNLDSVLKIGKADPGTPVAADPGEAQRRLDLEYEMADWAKTQLENWIPATPAGEQTPGEGWTVDGGRWTAEEGAVAAPSVARTLPAATQHVDAWPEIAATAVAPLPTPSPVSAPTASVTAAAAPSSPAPAIRAMQVHDCYLVVETAEGLSVIDQHALHERVLYEQFRNRVMAGHVEVQRLLIPETLELPAADAALLLAQAETLSKLGFGIEEFGGQTLVINACPVMLGRTDLPRLVREIAEKIASEGRAPSRRDLLDELLHMMACKAAIKSGHRLAPEEIDSLLAQRHLVDDAHHCPHGRPTSLTLSRAELDRQFGRLG